MSFEAGQILSGRFKLLRRLGEGAQATVWVAEHLALSTEVAVKLIDPQLAKQAEARERFKREATAAAQLRSANVVQILDHGIDGEQPFIVMELLLGQDLFDRLHEKTRLSLEETARIVTQVARALSRAHAAGIVHRDLKPENVFLVSSEDDETVKVLDFGVAKVIDPSKSTMQRTGLGTLLGTPHYMSPEQVKGLAEVDLKSDLWALGVIAYQCVTGALPFESEGVGDLLIRIATAEPPPPSRKRPSLPKSFDAWFAKACHRDPKKRFANAKEMAEALARVVEEAREPAEPAPKGAPKKPGGFKMAPPVKGLASAWGLPKRERSPSDGAAEGEKSEREAAPASTVDEGGPRKQSPSEVDVELDGFDGFDEAALRSPRPASFAPSGSSSASTGKAPDAAGNPFLGDDGGSAFASPAAKAAPAPRREEPVKRESMVPIPLSRPVARAPGAAPSSPGSQAGASSTGASAPRPPSAPRAVAPVSAQPGLGAAGEARGPRGPSTVSGLSSLPPPELDGGRKKPILWALGVALVVGAAAVAWVVARPYFAPVTAAPSVTPSTRAPGASPDAQLIEPPPVDSSSSSEPASSAGPGRPRVKPLKGAPGATGSATAGASADPSATAAPSAQPGDEPAPSEPEPHGPEPKEAAPPPPPPPPPPPAAPTRVNPDGI